MPFDIFRGFISKKEAEELDEEFEHRNDYPRKNPEGLPPPDAYTDECACWYWMGGTKRNRLPHGGVCPKCKALWQ